MKLVIEKDETYDYIVSPGEDAEEFDTIYDVDDEIGKRWLRISDEHFKMISEVNDFVDKKFRDELAKEE